MKLTPIRVLGIKNQPFIIEILVTRSIVPRPKPYLPYHHK